jgi:hypothetical protein
MTSEPDEIAEVRRQEEKRGKKPIDIAARRRRQILERKFKEALECNDVEIFKEALVTDLGQLPGSEDYERSLRIWHSLRVRRS